MSNKTKIKMTKVLEPTYKFYQQDSNKRFSINSVVITMITSIPIVPPYYKSSAEAIVITPLGVGGTVTKI